MQFSQTENRVTIMVTSQLLTDVEKFDEMVVDVITDLRKKHKRADCDSIHKEIVKMADFSNITKKTLKSIKSIFSYLMKKF